MENPVSASRAPVIFSSDQPVNGFVGLKRKQWRAKSQIEIIAREHLENKGAVVNKIKCFKKTGNTAPSLNPNEINVFLRLDGHNSVSIIC